MPDFHRDEVEIHYEEHGSGFPVLLFAPGGMRSAIPFWERSPWNPIEALSGEFRVVAMDQRNAGRSTAPIGADDGWHVYTADHLALADHLGLERFAVLGGCIGGPYCMGVIEAAPDRVAAAVLQQPIGRSADNQAAFYAMFDEWAGSLRGSRPSVDDAAWQQFRSNMYDGDFLFNVSRDFVSRCPTPLLVLMGDDLYHPQETSREIAKLAPNAELVEHWKDAQSVGPAVDRVREFLSKHAAS